MSHPINAPQLPPPPIQRGWTGTRITGHVLVALWAVAGAYLIYYLASNVLSSFVTNYWEKYVSGIVITVQLVAMSMVLGALLSLPIALALRTRLLISMNPPAHARFRQTRRLTSSRRSRGGGAG